MNQMRRKRKMTKRKKYTRPLTRLYVDLDGTLAEWRRAADPKDLYKKDYFLSLRPQKRLVNAVNFLQALAPFLGLDIYILSSYLPDSRYALEEKRAWIKRYLPRLAKKCRFVPCGIPKSKVIRDISERDYLLDDYKEMLHTWEGTSIKYLNGINSDWDRLSVRHDSRTLAWDLLQILCGIERKKARG